MSNDIDAALATMSRDYFIFAFLVSLGVIQIATAISRLSGLWLLPWRRAVQVLGFALILVGILYFTFSPLWLDGPWASESIRTGTSENREWGRASLSDLSSARMLNDIHGGMDGNYQAIFLCISTGLAFAVSVAVGSVSVRIRNRDSRRQLQPDPDAEGLSFLTDHDYLAALGMSWRRMIKTIRPDFDKLMSAAPNWSIPKIIVRKVAK